MLFISVMKEQVVEAHTVEKKPGAVSYYRHTLKVRQTLFTCIAAVTFILFTSNCTVLRIAK